MPALDVFNTDAFSTISLTDAINKMPQFPQKIGMAGLFDEQGVPTTSIMIEELDGVLNLVLTRPRGGEATQNTRDSRTARSIAVPHIPIEDRVNADEVQGVRAFGSESELQAVQTVVNNRLLKMSQQLDLTLEWHRIGALKGIVLDADGSTIYDLFSEFGVSQESEVDFDLDAGSPAAGAVRLKCHEVIRLIRSNLGGTPFPGVAAMCGSTFFDELIVHTEVAAAYERALAFMDVQGAGVQGQGGFLRAGLVDRMFSYAGILFWEYSNTMGSGSDVAVEATKAHLYPVGVPGLFVTRFAPANFVETVNTMGLPKYAKQAPDAQFQRWVDLHAQCNPLNVCTRPKVLIKAKNT
jgi:hypothetical protein